MINGETIEILSLLVSVLAIIIAIKQSKKAQIFQEKLAEAQNVFAKSEIKFEFFQTFFKEIIYVGNFPSNSVVTIPLDVYCGNVGEKKIKNAELYVTYPDSIHMSEIELNIKGSLKDIKYKLVDKSQFKHMMGYDYGNIGARTFLEHRDYIIVSDFKKTNSSIFYGETVVESKDKVKFNIKYNVAYSWVINFFLRHDEGSGSENCKVQIWDTSEKSIEEYIDNCKTNSNENNFENYLEGKNRFYRIFFKKQLRKIWNKTVRKTFLLIDLELEKDKTKSPIPKNAPKNLKDISLYDAIVKNQKILFVLNDGNVTIVNRNEFEERNKTSNYIMEKHFLSK